MKAHVEKPSAWDTPSGVFYLREHAPRIMRSFDKQLKRLRWEMRAMLGLIVLIPDKWRVLIWEKIFTYFGG